MAPDIGFQLQIEGVSAPLLRALVDRGVTELTPVQEACLPYCLAGKDVMAKAKTGTGKTLGFCIPTCERLLRSQAKPKTMPEGVDPIRAIILSSTRELATQITTQAQQLLTHTDFNVEEILGGASITNQRERLDPKINGFAFKYGGTVDLMVATPGRLLEHIESTDGFCERLQGVEVLVLDEVDMLLDGGFQRAIEAILVKLPVDRQSLCFSATVPAKLLPVLKMAMANGHELVDCVGEEEVDTHAKIEQAVVTHSLELSLLALYQSIRDEMQRRPDDYKIIAFLPTARSTAFNTAVLQNMGLDVMEIHSRCSQGERTTVSDTFRNNVKTILLSSDVSARGVDYPDISLVLQVSAPTSKEQYVQRLGRTGRAGKSGAGCLLLCDYEKDFLKQIKDLPITTVPLKLDCKEDLAKLQEAAARVDDELANQTYRAWIMAMVGQRKLLKWSKEDMVNKANLFASDVLGRSAVPPLQRDLVTQLGLAGIAALNVVDGPTADEVAAQEEADAEETLVVKVHKKEMGLGLMKDAKKATDAIMALDEEAALALQATLDEKGEAVVAGFKIVSDMVTVKMVKKTMKRSGSTNSMCSTSSAGTSTTGAALSRNGSALSLCSIASSDSEQDSSAQRAAPFKSDPEVVKAAIARVAAAGTAMSEAMSAVKEAGGNMKSDPLVVAAQKEMSDAKSGVAEAKTGKPWVAKV